METVDYRSCGRVSRARLQPSPSLGSVRVLSHVHSRRSRRIHSNQLSVDTVPTAYKTNYDCSVFPNDQVYSEMRKWMTKGIERGNSDAFYLHYLTCSRSVLLKSNVGYSPLLLAKIANRMKKNIVNTFNSQIL